MLRFDRAWDSDAANFDSIAPELARELSGRNDVGAANVLIIGGVESARKEKPSEQLDNQTGRINAPSE